MGYKVFDTPSAVRKLLSDVIRLQRIGGISTMTANSIIYGCNALLRSFRAVKEVTDYMALKAEILSVKAIVLDIRDQLDKLDR